MWRVVRVSTRRTVSGAAARHTISGGPRNRVNFSLVFQQATAEAPASPPQQPWDRLIREEFTMRTCQYAIRTSCFLSRVAEWRHEQPYRTSDQLWAWCRANLTVRSATVSEGDPHASREIPSCKACDRRGP